MPLLIRHNISGAVDKVLIPPGSKNGNISSVSIANTHASDDVVVDLYISTLSLAGSAATVYYILKGRLIQKGDNLVLSSNNIRFDNVDRAGDGLYIKLGASTSTVDVIIVK